VLVNVGAVKNTGVEAAVTLHVIPATRSFRGLEWTSSFNYSRNRNTVLDLGGETEIQAARAADDLTLNGTIIRVGEPMGVFYGYRTTGIIRDAAEAAAYTAQVIPATGTAWAAGDARIEDVNGDGRITSADRTIIGNPAPDFTVGWQNTFRFRRFELSALLDGSYGATLLNLNMYRLEAGSPRTNILRDRWVNRWTPTNPDGQFPRIGSAAANIGADIRSDLLEDGSYTRLRTVTLAFQAPEPWLARSGLSVARFYVTGANLFTWTDYSGFNPDVSSLGVGNVNRGIDVGAYPLARTVTVGINLTY
jgi:TonB-dependent starch-binding outer membrane protein SusC